MDHLYSFLSSQVPQTLILTQIYLDKVATHQVAVCGQYGPQLFNSLFSTPKFSKIRSFRPRNFGELAVLWRYNSPGLCYQQYKGSSSPVLRGEWFYLKYSSQPFFWQHIVQMLVTFVTEHEWCHDWPILLAIIPQDVVRFSHLLPNLVNNYSVPFPLFNHLDFHIGINASELVYEETIWLMKQYWERGSIGPDRLILSVGAWI